MFGMVVCERNVSKTIRGARNSWSQYFRLADGSTAVELEFAEADIGGQIRLILAIIHLLGCQATMP
jgi:hypothetical protein